MVLYSPVLLHMCTSKIICWEICMTDYILWSYSISSSPRHHWMIMEMIKLSSSCSFCSSREIWWHGSNSLSVTPIILSIKQTYRKKLRWCLWCEYDFLWWWRAEVKRVNWLVEEETHLVKMDHHHHFIPSPYEHDNDHHFHEDRLMKM